MRRERDAKPKGLWLTCGAMCLMNMAGFAFVDPELGSLDVQLPLFRASAALGYLVLWFYLTGRNWARILVLMGSGFTVLNLIAISLFNWYQQVIVAAEAAFGIFMLYWLNTRRMRAYFRGTRSFMNSTVLPFP